MRARFRGSVIGDNWRGHSGLCDEMESLGSSFGLLLIANHHLPAHAAQVRDARLYSDYYSQIRRFAIITGGSLIVHFLKGSH